VSFAVLPLGPSAGEDRVARGGAFMADASFGRCAYRAHDQSNHFQYIGFRVVNSNP